MTRACVVAAIATAICALAAARAEAANPTSLLVPQAVAFGYLGHSCGGIQEQAFATGFDAFTGDPVGAVYVQTRCGGSGRGGGYHVTTYAAWLGTAWDFSGALVSDTLLAGAPSVDPTFSAHDAHGDKVFNVLNAVNVLPPACAVGNTTYCTYRAYLKVPLPAAPTGVAVTSTAGQYTVSWVPDPAASAAITSSTVTATPVRSPAPVVTAAVSGPATSADLGPLEPQTTYRITVVNTDGAGSSPPGGPVAITTPGATTPPSAPTGLGAHWTAPGSPGDTLVASWSAPAPGDSPIDGYEITIAGGDGGGTVTQDVSGSMLTATFAVSDIPDWTIKVRAHNAAGYGPWSRSFLLGGT